MRMKMRTIGLLGIVTALALAACGGDDDTPTPQPTATRIPATATPADTPTPIVITVAGTPMVVTATPAPTSTPAPTAVMTRKPEGTLNVVGNLGNEQFLLRTLTGELPYWYMSEPLVGWDWEADGPVNSHVLERISSPISRARNGHSTQSIRSSYCTCSTASMSVFSMRSICR